MPRPSFRLPGRRTLAGGVAVLALTGLAACGGSDDSSKGSNDNTSTSQTSGDQNSAAPSSEAPELKTGDKVTPDQMTAIYKKAMTGVTSAHMTMTGKFSFSGQSINIDGDGDVSMDPLAEDMTMSLMGQKMHIILVDGTEYIQSPTAGNTWMKVSLDDLAKQSGMGDLSSALTNPLSMLDSMSQAITKATYAGKDGSGDHYQITVDLKKSLSAAGTDTDLPSGMPATMDEDVWFDQDGHLSKMTMDMGGSGSMQAEMSDYGKSVDIKAPPASQVTEMPSVG